MIVVDSSFPIVHNAQVELIWVDMYTPVYWNYNGQDTIGSQEKAPWWVCNFRTHDLVFL